MEKISIVYHLFVDGVRIDCYSRETLMQWIIFALDNGKTVTEVVPEVLP